MIVELRGVWTIRWVVLANESKNVGVHNKSGLAQKLILIGVA
jgi:hypothetical protein